MAESWPHAAIYLSATAASYWKWGEDQELSWSDGPTIAFMPELNAVLRRLATNGLPPFGSVLLLMAACRENWSEPPSRRRLLTELLNSLGRNDSTNLLTTVCDGLDKVNALPADLRNTPSAKAELAAFVFDNAAGRLSPDVSREVVDSLASFGGGLVTPSQNATLSYWLSRELAALRPGLARIDELALRTRATTGLDALPEPAPIEPPPLTGRAWLGWLEQQEEFAGLARLAKRMLAAIHLPRRLHDPDELPLGGITDIAPRGPLDRLLISELAHDDLTLAVRVAMNEALYLRRESPPRTPPRDRHILLDSGLRLWGLPRLFATAVGLAMSAHDDPHLEVQTHRAAGATLEPVKLNTVDGLRSHLAALDHRLHPGESLTSLAELLHGSEGGDAVIVTSDDTLADPAFQRALERSALGAVYIASVSRDGRFELQQYSRAGRKRLSAAQLSLEEILKEPPRAKPALPLRDASKAPLPAIFRASPFPLLLSAPVRPENSWYVHELGLLTLTVDGRLLRWNIPTQGAEQLATGLPPGRIFGATSPTKENSRICLVIGQLSVQGLFAVWVGPNKTVSEPVRLLKGAGNVRAVLVDKLIAYAAFSDRVARVDLLSHGLSEGEINIPPSQILAGSLYVRLRNNTNAPTWFRGVVPVCKRDLIRMFDVRGVEGPVGITPQGDVYYTGKDETKNVNHGLPLPVRCAAVSRDGLRFVLQHGAESVLVHTLSGASQKCGNVAAGLEPHLHLFAKPRPVRHRFLGIAIDPDGDLALISRRNTAWSLDMPSITFPAQATSKVLLHDKSFEEWKHESVAGFSLRRADFADGSVAVLDSRGLLHLQSSDKSVPECTIVLREGTTAGWCSDGRIWGPSYYIGARPATPAATISKEVIGPFVERLR